MKVESNLHDVEGKTRFRRLTQKVIKKDQPDVLKVIPENFESDQQEPGKQKVKDEKGKNRILYMMIHDA